MGRIKHLGVTIDIVKPLSAMNKYFHDGKLGDIVFSLPFIKATGGGSLFLCNGQGLADGEVELMHGFLQRLDFVQYVGYLPRGSSAQDVPDCNYDLSRFRSLPGIENTHLIRSYFEVFEKKFELLDYPFLKLNIAARRPTPYIVIHVGSKSRFDWAFYIRHEVVKKYEGHEIIITGSPDECQRLFAAVNLPGVVTQYSPFTLDLVQLINSAAAVLCTQNFVFSLALLLGKPIVLECIDSWCMTSHPNISYVPGQTVIPASHQILFKTTPKPSQDEAK